MGTEWIATVERGGIDGFRPVVRCKDCIQARVGEPGGFTHCAKLMMDVNPYFFCADGRRDWKRGES